MGGKGGRLMSYMCGCLCRVLTCRMCCTRSAAAAVKGGSGKGCTGMGGSASPSTSQPTDDDEDSDEDSDDDDDDNEEEEEEDEEDGDLHGQGLILTTSPFHSSSSPAEFNKQAKVMSVAGVKTNPLSTRRGSVK